MVLSAGYNRLAGSAKANAKCVSREQAGASVNDLRFISYLQIPVPVFCGFRTKRESEGGRRVSQCQVWTLIDERAPTWLFNIPITQAEIQ